jgi:hypothetical protein
MPPNPAPITMTRGRRAAMVMHNTLRARGRRKQSIADGKSMIPANADAMAGAVTRSAAARAEPLTADSERESCPSIV